MSRPEIRHEDRMDPATWPTAATPVTPGWAFTSIGFQGDPTDLGSGLNPWLVDWGPSRGWIVVAHPSYPAQRHTMDVYALDGGASELLFAAGELSNGVWGFFRPEHSAAE